MGYYLLFKGFILCLERMFINFVEILSQKKPL